MIGNDQKQMDINVKSRGNYRQVYTKEIIIEVYIQ